MKIEIRRNSLNSPLSFQFSVKNKSYDFDCQATYSLLRSSSWFADLSVGDLTVW